MVFRKFFGMIMSVSTLTIGSGAATPRSVVNFSMFPSRIRRNKRAFARQPVKRLPDLDHQGAGDHVVQAALAVREGDHQEADAEDESPR